MRPITTALTVFLLSAASMQAGAQAVPVPATLHACGALTSDKERLACFDHEMAKLEGAPARQAAKGVAATSNAASTAVSTANTAPNPTSGISAPAPASSAANTTLDPEQAFGLSGDQIRAREARQQGAPPPTRLKKITAQIASASQNSAGRWVITLDNGQVWRQAEERTFEASPGTTAKISSGAMGSFWLETNRHNWTRVERVL
jgi:hypothetical protein